jgi:hypothetical protein
MNIRQLKNIMKEINEPNEFELFIHDPEHPYYWIYKVENVRVKTLFSRLEEFRKPSARFDVFINGLFISENDFYIKFIKEKFPVLDRFGNPYTLEDTDEVKIKGDVENIK